MSSLSISADNHDHERNEKLFHLIATFFHLALYIYLLVVVTSGMREPVFHQTSLESATVYFSYDPNACAPNFTLSSIPCASFPCLRRDFQCLNCSVGASKDSPVTEFPFKARSAQLSATVAFWASQSRDARVLLLEEARAFQLPNGVSTLRLMRQTFGDGNGLYSLSFYPSRQVRLCEQDVCFKLELGFDFVARYEWEPCVDWSCFEFSYIIPMLGIIAIEFFVLTAFLNRELILRCCKSDGDFRCSACFRGSLSTLAIFGNLIGSALGFGIGFTKGIPPLIVMGTVFGFFSLLAFVVYVYYLRKLWVGSGILGSYSPVNT